jgi:hypothetical protein
LAFYITPNENHSKRVASVAFSKYPKQNKKKIGKSRKKLKLFTKENIFLKKKEIKK